MGEKKLGDGFDVDLRVDPDEVELGVLK